MVKNDMHHIILILYHNIYACPYSFHDFNGVTLNKHFHLHNLYCEEINSTKNLYDSWRSRTLYFQKLKFDAKYQLKTRPTKSLNWSLYPE